MTQAELRAAGYDVDAAVHARLGRFVSLLLEENRRVNLTSIRDEARAWVEHVCDSLALWPLIRAASPQTLLDLGSGGGVPGVPLACVCPELRVTLLDATRKKLATVERIVEALELKNVELAWGRAEVLGHDPRHRERYDAVTARAVAELRVLVECGSGFVRPGGVCWFFKTRAGVEAEAAAAEEAARACALRSEPACRYTLPDSRDERVIVVYRKEAALRDDLPRGPGRPKKRPL